jgi:Bacteriophage probable baseplate hub protein
MSGSLTFPVRAPRWILTYQGVNITSKISRMVTRIVYHDRLGGASGTLEIDLEDHEKLWQGSWKPQEGDLVTLMIGYAGESLLPCGDFQVDELSLNGPPDIITLRCLAAYITPAMRTLSSSGFECQTLAQIASTLAAKYGLSVIAAKGVSDLRFTRITQRQETDLGFLDRIAREHNYEFTIRGNQLVFYSRRSLEDAPSVMTLGRSQLLRFNFRVRTHHIYKASQVSYQSPARKHLLTQLTTTSSDIPTGDTLKRIARCDNGQQALLKATSALAQANTHRTVASIMAVGATDFAAGSNVTISGFGFNDGKYLIDSAHHRLDRTTGYTTEVEASRVE